MTEKTPKCRTLRRQNKCDYYRLKISVACVGQKSHVTCALDSGGKLSLMSGAVAGHSPGQNLRSVGDVLVKLIDVLVVYSLNLVNTESANFLASFTVGSSIVLLVCHDYTSFSKSEREIVAYRNLFKIVCRTCGKGCRRLGSCRLLHNLA